ncbi:MAG: asparagine--tRNA ligase [Planctomycetota bacterium]|nr:asparagine--tRNA ligase [Planctomycetota bacterium]
MPDPPVVAVRDLKQHAGETVTVRGWLYNRRSSKKLHFLQVRDGTGIVQAVAGIDDVGPELFEVASRLDREAAIVVQGSVSTDERAPGGVELHVQSVECVAPAQDYPLGKKDHGPDFLLGHRHLWLRSRRPTAVLRVRDTVIRAIRDFFHRRGFVNVDAPILTPAACEGTTTLFEVDYFDLGKAYLTQSGQLYMEAAAMALGKVYCFGPTFRAEKSKTRRHLTEFWMVEPEEAWATLDDVMDLAEAFLCAIVERVLEENRADLETLERDPAPLEKIQAPFPRITYDEAAAILKEKAGFEYGSDLGAPDETALSAKYERPLMIHRWPHEVKAFYMKRDPKNDKLALGVDVIAPEGFGEIIGGGERASSLEFLERQLREQELPEEAFGWYLDLRRYGSVPHGGFGLGLERTVAWICGLKHLREAIPFPRMLTRIYP